MTGKAKFVLCDFSLSTMFPSDSDPSSRLCPAWESECGTFEYHPPDAFNPESEIPYDPFTFDVACLGGMLCESIGVRFLFVAI